MAETTPVAERGHASLNRRDRARVGVHPRALPARGGGRRDRARARHAAPPGARRRAGGARGRREGPVVALAPPVVAAARPRAAALARTSRTLVDGTVLSAHQVDALSGTLTALLAEAQRNGNGNGNGAGRRRRLRWRPSASRARRSDDEDEPEEPQDWDDAGAGRGRRAVAEAPEDPNAGKRFWFEHATGAGKTVAALGFVEASRTGGILILTHRRNLVDQFHGELRDRGYAQAHRAGAARRDAGPRRRPGDGRDLPVVRAQRRQRSPTPTRSSSATRRTPRWARRPPASIRNWTGPVFIGMTATGALIARHVTDLFPTQTSRFDLAQAARRGVISPLRCVRIPPGPGRAHDRQGAAAPRRGGHRVRPGDAGRAARSAAVQPRDRRPLQDALQRRARASSTPPACATPTTSPQAFRDLGHEGAGRLGRDAQARAGADPRPLRARRHRRAGQRAAARRGLELAARDGLHAPRADRLASASTSSASAASRAAIRARRRASSSTSSIRRPSTTTRS